MSNYILRDILIISLLLSLALTSCTQDKKTNNSKKEVELLPEDIVELRADQIILANIETGGIETRMMSSSLKVSGEVTVSPQSLATVCMPLGGFVKTTTLMPGVAVTKGQTLAILENQQFVDIQQGYLEAKN